MDKEAQILKLELRKDEGSQTFTMRKLLHGLKTDATSPMLQAKQKLSQGQRFFFFFLNFWVYVLGFGFVFLMFLFKIDLDLNSHDF